MSQVDELLETLADGEGVVTGEQSAEPHIVIGKDRFITVPAELKKLGVQFDHDIETVTFDCPRYWDDHDLSLMNISINYTRTDNYEDCYPVKNLVVDDDMIHFDWTISRNVTAAKGNLSVSVCAKKVDEDGIERNHWNSEINKDFYISEGKECAEQAIEEVPDVVGVVIREVLNTLPQWDGGAY